MAFVVWIIATTTAWAECTEQSAQVEALERAVLEGRDDEARGAVDDLVAAFGCGPLAPRPILARLWLAQAKLLDRLGEAQATNEALLAAGELSPTTWVDGYGLRMRVRQLRLMSSEIVSARPRGSVEVEPEGYVTGIDGLRYDRFPARIPAGLHLVQVGPRETEMRHAELVDVIPDTELVVVTGLVPPKRSLTIEARKRRRLFTALAFAGGAVATYALTAGTNRAFDNNPQRGLAVFNNTLVIGSAGLLATSGTFAVHGLLTGRRAR